LSATTTRKANYAVLGGSVSDFTKVFGKPANDGGTPTTYLDYQPYRPPWNIIYKITISIDIGVDGNYFVSGIIFNPDLNNLIRWQDGINFCQSFLPADAIHLSDTDFAPPNQFYQQMYLSKNMAHEFGADHFMQGAGLQQTPVAPGTVQIMYLYTSSSNHTSREARIRVCYISLGQPY
ncbi:MAG TPA: hypothetical protein VGT44_07595, partial [Ktedonobacteraceae bacterium]|nr:hypothetical protein [Ktedonobacteraceae bacterium]